MRHSRGRADTLTAVATHMVGWTTPQAHDTNGRSKGQKAKHGTKHGCACLVRDADLVGYPTPQASDADRGPDYAAADRPETGGFTLQTTAQMAGWSTTSARDWKDSEGMAPTRTNPDGSEGRARDDQLPRQASLAGWTTSSASDGERAGKGITEGMSGSSLTQQARGALAGWATTGAADATRGSPETAEQQKARGANVGMSLIDQAAMVGPARLTHDGRLLIGSSAGMESGGQLDPEHSRLLMRLPDGWASCAPSETASTLKRRRSSASSPAR